MFIIDIYVVYRGYISVWVFFMLCIYIGICVAVFGNILETEE